MTSEDTVSTPVQSSDYAFCEDCKQLFATEDLANAHMDETLKFSKNARSHEIRHLQPLSPEERVEREIQSDVDDAMDDLFNELESRHSEAEIRSALKSYTDWADAYEAFCDGEGQ